MKKLLISLIAMALFLFSGIYFTGEMVAKETQRIFAKNYSQDFSVHLLSYEKQFLTATAVSELAISVEGSVPIVIRVSSEITHYPYKATIENKINFEDPEIALQVEKYFASKEGIRSREEVNLLGQLTGQLILLPGAYQHAGEQFSTQGLQLDYQVNLRDSSGSFIVSWPGMSAQTSVGDLDLESVLLGANFSLQAVPQEYDYFMKVAEIRSNQEGDQTQLQGLELRGKSGAGEVIDSIDSSNEWKIASLQLGDSTQRRFADNHIKMDIKGLYAPALALLNSRTGDPQQIEQALNALLEHGAQLTVSQLNSQTPWGEVNGALTASLQQGAVFAEVIGNPFILLDYLSGSARLSLPESLLTEPGLSESLNVGVMMGLLKQQDKKLTIEAQLEQGELTVNGRVIPL